MRKKEKEKEKEEKEKKETPLDKKEARKGERKKGEGEEERGKKEDRKSRKTEPTKQITSDAKAQSQTEKEKRTKRSKEGEKRTDDLAGGLTKMEGKGEAKEAREISQISHDVTISSSSESRFRRTSLPSLLPPTVISTPAPAVTSSVAAASRRSQRPQSMLADRKAIHQLLSGNLNPVTLDMDEDAHSKESHGGSQSQGRKEKEEKKSDGGGGEKLENRGAERGKGREGEKRERREKKEESEEAKGEKGEREKERRHAVPPLAIVHPSPPLGVPTDVRDYDFEKELENDLTRPLSPSSLYLPLSPTPTASPHSIIFKSTRPVVASLSTTHQKAPSSLPPSSSSLSTFTHMLTKQGANGGKEKEKEKEKEREKEREREREKEKANMQLFLPDCQGGVLLEWFVVRYDDVVQYQRLCRVTINEKEVIVRAPEKGIERVREREREREKWRERKREKWRERKREGD